MRDAQPTTVYLKDYTPPEFLIDRVDLRIELGENSTRVVSLLEVRPNPASKARNPRLELWGEQLVLGSVSLEGRLLEPGKYTVTEESLTLRDLPQKTFSLEIVTTCNPQANTSLEGLYLSKGMFCTQCEAEGFRKITYFLDRPDIMSRFTTTLVADKQRYPVLLSNGNPVAKGEAEGNRHWVKWEDPFPKPCYLFALVAGDLSCLEDSYTTQSGRRITLQIFVEAYDLDKCGHAMRALQKSMRWDEQVYGREYDLDLYMIVAVSHFNMGAMENKGLNIFNTKFVLARPDTATDWDFEHVEGVIAHEYFHNWTGNRITCRDWFQLSLKEGFTVFRDQEFTADQGSRGVKRINDVNMLRSRQFAEDAGPLAHPIRPDSYMEINNFYTLTVYEKGAEVVRMIHTLLGPVGFRNGSDLYFERHDGQAVTTDDFVSAMEDANGVDLTQFRRWYSQAGTPVVDAETHYDEQSGTLALKLRQQTPPTPGQSDKLPLLIPVTTALFDQQGQQLEMRDADGQSLGDTAVLQLTETEQSFVFSGLAGEPVVSVLRGFSAPVRLNMDYSNGQLAVLLASETDPFCRWEAGQRLASRVILEQVGLLQKGQAMTAIPEDFLATFGQLLRQSFDDKAFLGLLLTLPSETYLSELMEVIDPVAIHQARQYLQRGIAERFRTELEALYASNHQPDSGEPTADSSAARTLKNTALAYLVELNDSVSQALVANQYEQAGNMTDQFAALSGIANTDHPRRAEYLEHFYQQWQQEALVIDKWFSLQASSPRPDSMDEVLALMQHDAFDMRTPNRVRSVVGAFSMANPVHFHALDGRGYRFLADQVIALNGINPQVASRMLGAMTHWARYDQTRQQLMRDQLERIMETPAISRDVYEIASKSLG